MTSSNSRSFDGFSRKLCNFWMRNSDACRNFLDWIRGILREHTRHTARDPFSSIFHSQEVLVHDVTWNIFSLLSEKGPKSCRNTNLDDFDIVIYYLRNSRRSSEQENLSALLKSAEAQKNIEIVDSTLHDLSALPYVLPTSFIEKYWNYFHRQDFTSSLDNFHHLIQGRKNTIFYLCSTGGVNRPSLIAGSYLMKYKGLPLPKRRHLQSSEYYQAPYSLPEVLRWTSLRLKFFCKTFREDCI